jgi:hypothetical protein
MPVPTYFGGGGYTSDEFNALHGQYSPEAILNALSYSKGAGSTNPFEDILKHATDFKGPRLTSAMLAQRDVIDGGGGGGEPRTFVPPVTIPTTGNPATNRLGPKVTPEQAGGDTGTPIPPPPTNPRPIPSGVDPALWNDVGRYVMSAAAQGADASLLYAHPDWITEFRNWAIANNAGDPTKGGVDIVDFLWYAHPEMRAGLQSLKGRSGVDTVHRWQQQNPGGGGGGTTPTTTPPPGGGGTSFPVIPPWTPPTYPTTPQPTPPMQPSAEYLSNLDRALQTSQSRELQNALREYRSAAGAVGLQNTGAYLPGQQDLVADLASRFGQQRAEAMLATSEAERGRAFQGSQNELDRVLQRYGIDVGAYTSRFNTTTNAGVQQAANQMQYDLGLRGIQVDKDKLAELVRSNTLNYNLGVGGQDLSKLQGDQNTMIQLFQLMQSMGPEAFFHMLFGQQAPPTYVGYPH